MAEFENRARMYDDLMEYIKALVADLDYPQEQPATVYDEHGEIVEVVNEAA